MNKNYLLAIIFGIISLILCLLFIFCLFSNFNRGFYFLKRKTNLIGNKSNISYDYQQTEISSINIDLTSDIVLLSSSKDSKIHVEIESSDLANIPIINLKGKTLSISRNNTNPFNLRNWQPVRVLIKLPADFQLKELSIETSSGSITSDNLEISAEDLSIETTSGAVNLSEFIGKSMKIESTSGKIETNSVFSDKLIISSTSGRIESRNISADTLKLSSTSGSIEAEIQKIAKNAKIETVSGSITLSLKKDSDFTLSYDTVTGSFNSDFGKLDKEIKSKYNNGTADISLNTVTGSIKIHAN